MIIIMVTLPNRRTVFNVMQHRALNGGNAETLVHLAPAMAYTKPRGPLATQKQKNAWKWSMSQANGFVSSLREDALEILHTSDDPKKLKTALLTAWPNPVGKGAAELNDRELFAKHWLRFLYLFRPHGVQLYDYSQYRANSDQNLADAYASFLSELIKRQRGDDYFAILAMTIEECVVEFVRAPRLLGGVFRLLCAALKRPLKRVGILFSGVRKMLGEMQGANARRAAAWTRILKLVRCIARTKVDKLAVLKMYITTVHTPVAREINDLVRHAKSLPSVPDQARFLWNVVHQRRPDPSAAVARAVLGSMTRDRLPRLMGQYARLNTRNRVQTRAGRLSLSNATTTHLTNRLATWGVLRNSRRGTR